jgi:hypothetical protein
MQTLVTICSRFLRSATVDNQQSAPAQFPVDKCHAIIGDRTYADAILDPIVHNAHRVSPRCRLWAQGGDLNSSSTRCQRDTL